jgi:hypothetical protein
MIRYNKKRESYYAHPGLESHVTHAAFFHATSMFRMNLDDFPFDRQTIFLRVRFLKDTGTSTWLTNNLIDLQLEQGVDRVDKSLAVSSYIRIAEWDFDPHSTLRQTSVATSDPEADSQGRIFPCYDARFIINRRYGWYLSNVLLVATLLDWMSLALFMFEHMHGLEVRVNLLLSLLFVQIAFKFTLSTALPKLDYSTLLDDFILESFVYLAVMLGGVCAVARTGEQRGEFYDGLFSATMPALLVLKLLRFAFRSICILRRNRHKDQMKSFEKVLHEFHTDVVTPQHSNNPPGALQPRSAVAPRSEKLP